MVIKFYGANKKSIISIQNYQNDGKKIEASMKMYVFYPSSKMKWNPVTIDGVNTNRIASWNPSGNYYLAVYSCVSQTSRALNASGAYNIGIHPYMLNAQMYLRSVGFRPMLYSYHFYQY
jgi:hypothetical protein